MNFLKSLERNLRVALFITVATLVAFLGSIYCFFVSYAEIPLGILLGGVTMSLLHLLNHIFLRLDTRNGTIKFTLIGIIVRYVVLVGLLVLLAFTYYYWKVRLFNLYAFVGAYTLGFIILLTDYIIYKNQD